MQVPLVAILISSVLLVTLGARPGRAGTITVEPVIITFPVGNLEFSSPRFIDAPPEANLRLSTTGNLFLSAPGGRLFADALSLRAAGSIVLDPDGPLTPLPDGPLLCDPSDRCPTFSFDLDTDIVLTVTEPVGELSIEAANIFVSSRALPQVLIRLVPEPQPFTLAWVALAAGIWLLRDRRASAAGAGDRG